MVAGSFCGELARQFGVRIVGEAVFARACGVAGVEIAIFQHEAVSAFVGQQVAILVERAVEAAFEESRGLRRRRLERQRLERPDFRQNPNEKGENARADSGLLVLLVPLLAITRAREIVDELAFARRRAGRLPSSSFFMCQATRVSSGITALTACR